MKTHSIILTDTELQMVIYGLNAIKSDYCTNNDEEQPYSELVAKLSPLLEGETK